MEIGYSMREINTTLAELKSRFPQYNVKVVKTDVFWDRKAAALVEKWRDHVDQ